MPPNGQHLIPDLGRHQLDQLGPEHVQTMLNTLAAEGRKHNTVRSIWAVLRRALNQALRCRVLNGPSAAPATVIVKRVNPDEGQIFNSDALDPSTRAFFNEWASLEFLTQLANQGGPSIAPRLYCADRAAGLLVMEDLGQGESLVQPLLGADRMAAESALDAYFRSLGRLGAQTHARADEYWAIRNALGPPDPYIQPTLDGERDTLQRWLAIICDACGAIPVPGTEVDLAEAARFNAAPGPFAALSQSDTCPDNCLREGEWMRLLDFEWGWVRNALNEEPALAATFRLAGASTACRPRQLSEPRRSTALSWPRAALQPPTFLCSIAS